MSLIPENPSKGDTFTNPPTGVEYTFDGVKWLSSGGEELDLSGFATKVQMEEVDRTAIMRDDALKKEHDEDSIKQSAINAGVVVSLDELFWRDVSLDEAISKGDAELQGQIDGLGNVSDYVSKTESWDMALGTSLAVNVLKNVDGGTPFVYYDGDPEGTHPCGLVNRFMLHDYVDKKLADSSKPELPKFKLVAGDYTDWDNGCIAFFDGNGKDTTSIDATRSIVISSFDVDGKRWGRDADCQEYLKHFTGHANVTSEDGLKTLFNMSPHYQSKCQMFYWPGDDEYPYAGYIIDWQGLQSHTVTSRESVWSVGSFYRLSIPEIFF